MKTVFLCGFMGCGKSTIGSMVANQLGMDFVDSDTLIEERCGKTIPEIFQTHGEAYFRDIEFEVCKELSLAQNKIVATGGGMMTFERCFTAVRDYVDIIFLDLPFDVCYKRIKNTNRPIVLKSSAEELEMLYNERKRFYIAHSHRSFVLNASPIIAANEFINFISE